MTMKTGSAYDVLFDDRKYKDLLDKVDQFLEKRSLCTNVAIEWISLMNNKTESNSN